MRVLHEDLVDQLSNGLHGTFLCALLYTELCPVREVWSHIALVSFEALPELLRVTSWDDGFDLVNHIAVPRKEFLRLVVLKPDLQSIELLLILTDVGKRNLVRMERSLDKLPMQLLRSRPALWCPQDDNRPSGFHNWLPRARSILDLANFFNRPAHRAVKICIDVLQILDNAYLVSVSGEQSGYFFVVHATKNGPLADFEAV